MYTHVLSMFVENKVNTLMLFLTCSSMFRSYLFMYSTSSAAKHTFFKLAHQ